MEQAAQKMSEKQIRRLPVLSQDKQLVGIISLADISNKASKDLAAQALKGILKP